jgi:hypothetical protein
MNTVLLSKMSVGDFGILDDNTVAQLRDNGKQGGCEHDLWLAFCGEQGEYEDDFPIIIVDTDQVSGVPE